MSTSHADADGHHARATTWSRLASPHGRGAYRAVTFLTLFALLFGGLALLAPTSASAQSTTTTTDYLNLRAEPSLDGGILSVIPVGEAVTVNGDPTNGFYPISYGGQSGYAHGAYLTVGGGWSGTIADGGATGAAWVIDGALNLRSGPSTDYGVITVMEGNAQVQLTGESGNGYLGVIYNGMYGYAFADYLSTAGPDGGSAPAPADEGGDSGSVPVGGAVTGSATVVDGALNMRSGPGTGYAVVMVLQDGAAVELMGDPQGGFYPVRFNGTTGWSSADWLRLGGGGGEAAPAPAKPAPAPSGQDDIIAIIYAAADRFGQPREDMLRVARCESVLDPNAVNASSGASGLFQFMPGTWATTPYAEQSVFEPTANANAAAWMWSVGRRNEWTCQ
ncbi:MAG TPA: SH3 domain-containing protein [Thermomicrobiales bacterium]|nr:SH3 domain-containing protein [Thermomicrobiales bacterium]